MTVGKIFCSPMRDDDIPSRVGGRVRNEFLVCYMILLRYGKLLFKIRTTRIAPSRPSFAPRSSFVPTKFVLYFTYKFTAFLFPLLCWAADLLLPLPLFVMEVKKYIKINQVKKMYDKIKIHMWHFVTLVRDGQCAKPSNAFCCLPRQRAR